MLKLAEIFSDGAVLQRNKEIRIFGEGTGEITVSFDKNTVKTNCENGKFCAALPPHGAGVGYTLSVSDGKETLTVENISVGEVFIIGGQSNAEMPLAVTEGAEDELEYCENPNISFYSIPQAYIKGEYLNMFRFQYMDYSAPVWKKCNADSAKDFSAVGYYVAKKLQKTLKVPIGVIGCNWGCRIIECFIPTWAFDRNEDLINYRKTYEESLSKKTEEEYRETYETFKRVLDERSARFKDPMEISYGNATYANLYPLNEWWGQKWPEGPYDANRPGCVYHNMLEDITPYALSFVVWYNGEADPRPRYGDRYGVLVESWREAFCESDMAFYAIEIAPFYGSTASITVRSEQRRATLKYKNAHLITSVGLGDKTNIHPIYKRELSYRAARSVLYHTYGIGEKSENPYAVSAKFEPDCVRVKFENDDKLVLVGTYVADLELSSDGKNFVQAKAKIEDGELIVWADGIAEPTEIRYCYITYYASQNIFNSAALPASPFRFTKDEPVLKKPLSEDKQ